jgi:hypothetical protein
MIARTQSVSLGAACRPRRLLANGADRFAQDKRLKRAEFFLINRFAAAAAVLGAMVGRSGVKTIEQPS